MEQSDCKLLFSIHESKPEQLEEMIIVYCDELASFIVATTSPVPGATHLQELRFKMLASFKHSDFKHRQRKKGINETFQVSWI